MIITVPVYAIPRKKSKTFTKTKRISRGAYPEVEFQTLLDEETKKLETEDKDEKNNT